MSLYYFKQDNTIWGCGDPECCGETYEQIDENFVWVDSSWSEVSAQNIQSHQGGGEVLEFREATELEDIAWRAGWEDGKYGEGYPDGF